MLSYSEATSTTGNYIRFGGMSAGNVVTVDNFYVYEADQLAFHVDATGNIWSGSSTYVDAPFKVSNAGALVATSATIIGDYKTSVGVGAGHPGGQGVHLDTSANELHFYGASLSTDADNISLLASIGIGWTGAGDLVIGGFGNNINSDRIALYAQSHSSDAIVLESIHANAINVIGGTVLLGPGKVGIGITPTELLHISGVPGNNSEAPISVYLYGAAASSTWTAGAVYARLLFGNNDASGDGDGGVKSKIEAYVEDVSGVYSGLSFWIGATGTTLYEALRLSGQTGAVAIPYGLHVGGTSSAGDNNLLVDGTGTITGGFGCNTKTAQTAYASGGAVTPGAGAYGASSAANFAALVTLVTNIRAALVANGIMS